MSEVKITNPKKAQISSIALQQLKGTTYTLDPVSEAVVQTIPRHQDYLKLNETIIQSRNEVVHACQSNRVSFDTGELSYEQFLAGLLFKDEQMLVSNQFLSYTNVVFQAVTEAEGQSDAKKNMIQGRAFLTNHRIILLSDENYKGLSFTEAGTIKADNKPISYILGSRCSDVLHYQSIPLGCVRNVELNTSCGITADAVINSYKPCCCCLCCSVFSCCQGNMCLVKWVQESLTSVVSNQRIMTFGATLPPWGHRYMVQIHVKEDVHLRLLKNFLVELQHFAPDLYTGALNRKE